jgi:hypothetical protein
VIHGIGDRGRHRDSGQLAEALGTERAGFLIELDDEEGLEPRDIRVRRHEVAGIVSVEEAALECVEKSPSMPPVPIDRSRGYRRVSE